MVASSFKLTAIQTCPFRIPKLPGPYDRIPVTSDLRRQIGHGRDTRSLRLESGRTTPLQNERSGEQNTHNDKSTNERKLALYAAGDRTHNVSRYTGIARRARGKKPDHQLRAHSARVVKNGKWSASVQTAGPFASTTFAHRNRARRSRCFRLQTPPSRKSRMS